MAKSKRRSEAIWMENQQRWQVKVQKDGTRRTFYSTIKGKRGKIEAEKKADEWLESGAESARMRKAWEQFLAYTETHSGTSNYTKIESIGRRYILPVVGERKIEAITPKIIATLRKRKVPVFSGVKI